MRKAALVCTVLVVTSLINCISLSNVPERQPTSLAVADPVFADIVKVLAENKPRTVSAFLESFHKKFPSFFGAYVLGYKSGALQGSSYENPRAIVFGKTGRLILAFNGDPKQEGFGDIETLEYVNGRGPVLRNLAFIREPKHMKLHADDIERGFSTADVQVSKPNPSQCMECHGFSRTHPNWKSYFIWAGFYGSEDDNVFQSPHIHEDDQDGGPEPAPYVSLARYFHAGEGKDPERKSLLEFQKKLSGQTPHARYKFLSYLTTALGFPYKFDGVCDFYDANCFPGFASAPNYWESPETYSVRPNSGLVAALFRNQGRYLAEEILETPKLYRYRFTFAAAAVCSFNHPFDKDEGLMKPQEILPLAMPRNLYIWHARTVGDLETIREGLTSKVVNHRRESIEQMVANFGSFLKAPASDPELKRFADSLHVTWPLEHFPLAVEFLGGPYGLHISDFALNKEQAPDFDDANYAYGFFEGTIITFFKSFIAKDGYPESLIPTYYKNVSQYKIPIEICKKLITDSQASLAGVSGQR